MAKSRSHDRVWFPCRSTTRNCAYLPLSLVVRRPRKCWNCRKQSSAFYSTESSEKMPKRYYEQDGSLTPHQGKTIAIIGYGSQGHAHALNLRDSGLQVVVGLHAGSKSKSKAEGAGLRVLSVGEATKAADFIMVLLPDHLQGEVYRNDIAPSLSAGKTLMFAHGFNIHFNEIK